MRRFDPIITEISDKLWHLHVVDKQMFDLKTILECRGDKKLAEVIDKVIKENKAILGEDHPLSQEATLFSELSLSESGVSLGGHLLTAKPDPKNTEIKVEELTNWWKELETFFDTPKCQPSTKDAACSVLIKWVKWRKDKLSNNTPDTINKLQELLESIAIARFQTPKRDPKANIPAPGTNMLASETGNLTPHKSGSPYPIPEKVPKSSKDEINQEITTKGDGDKPDKTNIKITPSKQRAMDGIGNISSQDKRNKITSSPIMKSAEMKSAETKNVIGLLNRESSSYGSYSEILRYGEPIRPVDYYSEDITLPCPLMKLSGSLEEERNCPHLHLVQGEYEYSLSLLSKNPLYINAILLRMKLLGMVVAIKREIVDFMASQHKKHSEFTDDKTKGNWDRAYNFLGAFHDVMINDNTGWRKKLYLKNWRVTWYWIENMIGVKLGEDNIKSFMFWLSLILIVMVIGTGCVYLTNHDTCLFKLPFSEYQINIVDAAAAFSAGFISLYIFVVGFNFQSIEDREAFHQHDQFNEMLNEARARLTQFNLSVQTGNTAADEKIIYANLPEEFIREINTVMQIKEAVGSLDSVIKARMNCVGAKVRELRAEKQKSRRMVMAAGGAIFTGFFAHEVGMSVLEYNHLKNNADPLTFLNSLGVGKGSQIPHFEHTLFHKEALDGTGWVLLITLIFTVAAAILASRRPSEEGYNSEHGEHH